MECPGLYVCIQGVMSILITLKRRLETAAAAIVHRMMMRRRPLVFMLVFPLRNGASGFVGAIVVAAIPAVARNETTMRLSRNGEVPSEVLCRLNR